ncbi:transducin/WD40 repeat-like superfamily protein [Actinidia rufa]|uniref:Transducin/WD40 repeat-like superfamily protein n=1 Tax=Actinidia rufa TaxID=165716 RepID=A0A7J0H030_9ERIC|nr:transducin/WD40 repeat-like superfamily protein [Actinidia rufa]
MKCRSVACIWSPAPPPHRVTAAAALSHPPTLYTGGSDGSIVWWNTSSTVSNNKEIVPVAMLCGHAASIADMGICFPAINSGDGKIDYTSNVSVNSNSSDYGALISVCTDGVLCVWSRGSGHCKRRRKMPPWVGSPSVLRALPRNPRYVCVACCFIDAIHLVGHHFLESSEGDEASMDKDPQYRKPSKCTVVIIDTYTLTIVQTIFHGILSIGPLRFMAIVPPVEDMEKQSVLLGDSYGKLQRVQILKETNSDGVYGTALHNLEMADWAEDSSEGLQVVAFATSGKVLAHIYTTYCILRLVATGTTIGQISFINDQLFREEGSGQSNVIGGMFLESDDAMKMLETQDSIEENFAVWNNRGFAVVYRITYLDFIFHFELLSVISAVAHPISMRLSILFIQSSCYLLRIESICFHVEEPLLWKPHVTTWLLPHDRDNNLNLHQECRMLSEGRFFVDWIGSSTYPNETELVRHDIGWELTGRGTQFSQDTCVPCHNVDNVHATDENYWLCQKERLISSSMVISESYYIPNAVVYGFHNGDIEVVRFNVFLEGIETYSRSQGHEIDSNVSKQYFLGHTGAVLCLAAHRMVSTANRWSLNCVLVSGSMDCTIRIWDLGSGNLITVMHNHVAPVNQIILPPPQTDRPWNDCFLSVGEDSCVTLVSLETLRVERMFPGHPYCPAKVVWDGARGYLACLCQNHLGISDALDVLYIWDVKTGARERVLRGTASHSMFDHFCEGINTNSPSGGVLSGNTSASSLLLPLVEDANLSQSHSKKLGKGVSSSNIFPSMTNITEGNASLTHPTKGNSAKLYSLKSSILPNNKHPINCACPFPGIAALSFDLGWLMSLFQKHEIFKDGGEKRGNTHVNELGTELSASDKRDIHHVKEQGADKPSPHHVSTDDSILVASDVPGTSTDTAVNDDWIWSLEGCLLIFSLSFLHLWDVDPELDKLLMIEMKLKRPENLLLSSGLQGDRGSLTLAFPSSMATLELWKSSSEFSAIRSLTMVSLAQRMISWSHCCSAASSALAAFYTRNCLERVPDLKPPLLQLLVSFWQDKSEHVRMAARSLFHCAASRAIPLPLRSQKALDHENLLISPSGTGENEHKISNTGKTSENGLRSDSILETQGLSQAEESEILAWLESFEMQDWISSVGGTTQDAMTSHIIVAAALAIWYPSLVKPKLAMLVVHPLMKLVMALNDKYSSTSAELLAEGMETIWKECIPAEIPHLIGDIFFQIEFVSGAPTDSSAQNPAIPPNIRETLVGILLPSLATADILGFLNVIESQIWSTASDSPVHVVSLMTLIRVIRGSPRNLAQYLGKVVNFILQTMDPSNSVMRNTCFQSSVAALKEVVRVFPMVALNETSTRLAVGDVVGEVNNASIRVYDMQSVTKIKVLDANGPPGLPSLLGGVSEVVTAISALSFSPDGEGLLAFSEHGLMIRWWSLGSAWWEKLSRNLVPVQCTKLIFVPPWEGFSPNSTRLSIMASIMDHDRQADAMENTGGSSDVERLKLLIHDLDLSYRLEWVGEKKVLLSRHGHELGTFQL